MLKQGYKQTEVGVIPEEWDVKNLIDLSDGGMQNGAFYEVSRKGSGVFFLNVGNLYETAPITTRTLEKFDATTNEIERFKVKHGDLFFTRSSIVPSGIAYCNWYKEEHNEITVFDSHVVRFKTDTKQVVPMYLYLQCISHSSRKYFISNAKVATMTTIDQNQIGRCPIPVPTYDEQEHIAEALSDVDSMISSLEKLIAKKKVIKQGAMLELLTGKKRLHGFTGEWKNCTIGKMGEFYSGLTGKSKKDFDCGEAYYITFLNVLSNVKIDTSILASVDIKEGEMQNAVKKGDLFFNTSSETPEEVGMCAVLNEDIENTYLNSFCFGFRLSDNTHNPLFLSYYLNSAIGRKIMSVLAQGATRYNLSKNTFAETVIKLPPKEEQTAITSILSDMDNEIENLKQKLAKVRQIKQGMMQQLLTGKIRLV